ncbi:pentapeptide repeat-containing protein [Oerskovia sp. KBS0722]|uniref:pentapeptide repeat-containing protein n=1 Tax=Oerskovia sp. KBS0722 TaxID=1179673 RepID=UPI00352A898C
MLPGPSVGGRETIVHEAVHEIRNVAVENLDLRGARIEHLRLVGVTLRNCRFDGSELRDLRVWWSTVENCSFVEADLKDSSLGGRGAKGLRRRTTIWRACDFRRADLRRTGHASESYADCDFRGARLSGVDFDGAVHEGSLFSGLLSEVVFRRFSRSRELIRGKPNELRDCDFRETLLDDCSFYEIDLQAALLPLGRGHLTICPKVAVSAEVLGLLGTKFDSDRMVELRVRLERLVAEGPSSSDAIGVILYENLGRSEVDRSTALELIRTASAQIAH